MLKSSNPPPQVWTDIPGSGKRKLRIAQVAPLVEDIPPKLYGGAERTVSWLTEALIECGHGVTLFASGESITSARLVPAIEKALRLNRAVVDWTAVHVSEIEEVVRRQEEFDIIHSHLDHLALASFSQESTPFITTLHGRLDIPEYAKKYQAHAQAALCILIQRTTAPDPFRKLGSYYPARPPI